METNDPNHSEDDLKEASGQTGASGPSSTLNTSFLDNNILVKLLEGQQKQMENQQKQIEALQKQMENQQNEAQKQTQQILEAMPKADVKRLSSSHSCPAEIPNSVPENALVIGHGDNMSVSSILKKLEFPWADRWAREIARKGAGTRKGLLVANTYSNHERICSLPGAKKSAEAMRNAFEDDLATLDKTPIECSIIINRTKNELTSDLDKFTKECNKEKVNTIVFYFAGHGGHEGLDSDDSVEGEVLIEDDKVVTGNKYMMDELMSQSVKEGGNFILGDPDKEGCCGKIFKNKLISIICKGTPDVSHRIIIFDCCRGNKRKEMSAHGEKPKLTVKFSDLEGLYNAHYKNTYVFHSTLPHQVAYCRNDGRGLTNFSKYFTKFLGHMDLSSMDVAINAALKYDENIELEDVKQDCYVQMIELVKWVDTPFQF